MRLLLAAIIIISTAVAADAGKRVALVFGEDKYRHMRTLDNAVNDALAIEDVLARLGFEVTVETNRDLKRMRRALSDFVQDGASADVAFVFFAGHGVEIAGRNMLLPIDADASSRDALEASSLSLEELRSTVARVSKIGLIVLDACREDPFASSLNNSGRGVTKLQRPKEVKPGLGRMGKAENTLFAFSAAPGETAADGDGDNSPFTAALAKYLDTEGLEIRSVLALVQQEVYDRSRGKQLPYFESGLPDLFFASQSSVELPEREKLLLAMAGINAEVREDVEHIATDAQMPLAPLYAALISSGISKLPRNKRIEKLKDAADAITRVQTRLLNLSSNDPRVTALRLEAEKQLSLGALDTAQDRLDEAIHIDAEAVKMITDSQVTRLLSQAATRHLSGTIAVSELKYDTAIASYEEAADLFDKARKHANIEGRDITGDDLAKYQEILSGLGESQRTLGILDAAESTFQQAHDTIETALKHSPDSTDLLAKLAFNKMKIGDMRFFAGGDKSALEQYEASKAITQELVRNDPADMSKLRDLAIIHERIGSTQHRLGEYARSRDAHKTSYELINRVAESDPDNAEFRRDVGVAYNKLGRVRLKLGDTAGSGAAHKFALEIFTKLHATDAKNTKVVHDLGYTFEYLGRVYQCSNEPVKAFESRRKSIEFRRNLVEINPEHNSWRWELYWTYHSAADLAGDMVSGMELREDAQDFLVKLDAAGKLKSGGPLIRANRKIEEAVEAGLSQFGFQIPGGVPESCFAT